MSPHTKMYKQTILAKVGEKIEQSLDIVKDDVVESLVKREVERRSGKILDVIKMIDSEKKELIKIKPDIVLLDDIGNIVSSNFSQESFKRKKEIENKINKYESAINKALSANQYQDLFSI
jgi:hypothetical protein